MLIAWMRRWSCRGSTGRAGWFALRREGKLAIRVIISPISEPRPGVERHLDSSHALQFCFPQAQRIGDHGHRTEAHGCRGQNWIKQQAEERIEHASRDRHA